VVGAIRVLRYVSPDENGVDLAQYEITPGVYVPLMVQLDANGNPIGTATNPLVARDATDYTQALEYDVSSNLIYHGRAAPGSATGAPSWQIKKFSYSGTNLTAVQYANGSSAFTAIWDNRATLGYS
jgi:hypothetical protein